MSKERVSKIFLARAKRAFLRLPSDQDSRDYEEAVVRLSKKVRSSKDELALLELIRESDRKIAYPAFYAILTYYRHRRDFDKMDSLIKSCIGRFGKEPSFNHVYIQYEVHSLSISDYDALLARASEDMKRVPRNYGYAQAFANAFATVMSISSPSYRRKVKFEYYHDALDASNRAIDGDPGYAKFYATKAKILSYGGFIPEALSLLNKAISLENSERDDYAIRLLDYERIRTEILIMRERLEMEEGISKGKEGDYPVYEGQGPYVFISYKREEREKAIALSKALEKIGIHSWFDQGIAAGEEWKKIIVKKIESSFGFVVLYSQLASTSAEIRKEIDLASQDKKTMVVVKRRETEFRGADRYALAGLHSIILEDFPSDDAVAGEIARSFKDLVKR